jgi:hypothetical protein
MDIGDTYVLWLWFLLSGGLFDCYYRLFRLFLIRWGVCVDY